MPSRRLDIPTARRELTNQLRELDAALFAVSGASDTDVVKLKRCEASQRAERKRIRKRGWQLNELERMRELRRLAKEAKQREETK
jgi:hypothetical protein